MASKWTRNAAIAAVLLTCVGIFVLIISNVIGATHPVEQHNWIVETVVASGLNSLTILALLRVPVVSSLIDSLARWPSPPKWFQASHEVLSSFGSKDR